METIGTSRELLETKISDYKFNAGLMPKKARILSKIFAKTLGRTAAKVASVYENMYSQIESGLPIEEISESVKRDINAKSKVKFQPPFIQPKQARICGLVAMSYSGFLDREIELHSALMQDLKSRYSIDNILERSEQIASENPERYADLLQKKQQAIYDFGVLMGITDDNMRLNQLKENMPKGIANYFERVVSAHKGALGVSWPLPLKKFSGSIKAGLCRDTISCALQKGTGKDFGFSMPEKANYEKLVEEIKGTASVMTSKDIPFLLKWRTLATLPATTFYLSGMNAYAEGGLNKTVKEVDHYVAAGITAATPAATTAEDDVGAFLTTWITWFTTLV